MGADRGNQMCWDQTGYCRGNGWQTSGGVPPAEVLREGHLLYVCAGWGWGGVGGCLSIDAVYLICPLSCLCSDVCLSELVGVFHCLSK